MPSQPTPERRPLPNEHLMLLDQNVAERRLSLWPRGIRSRWKPWSRKPSLLVLALAIACGGSQDGDGAAVRDSGTAVEVRRADSAVSLPPSVPMLMDSIPMRPNVDTGAALDSLILTMPVEGTMPWELRDTFGDPRTGGAHEALDIMAPRGTRVLSATSGRLTKLHGSVRGGIMVYAADASDRYVLMYGHLDRYADGLTEGMSLAPGQLIGYVGSTGSAAAAGPHLHFAIARGQPSVAWWKGEPVNPYPLLYRMKQQVSP